MLTKAPPQPPNAFDQRWTAWGAAYGGASTTNGDPVVGSTDVTTDTYGFAAGMDNHVTPDTVLGFALAGGGTNWSLAQNLGNGRSDAFQAGVYGKPQSGPAYLAAALAFANHWMTTDRTAPLGDQLTARFDAQSYGGAGRSRLSLCGEADDGVTPYAASRRNVPHAELQRERSDRRRLRAFLQRDDRDRHAQRARRALRRSDGARTMPVTLRARLAWAHDWVSNPSLGAAFQALPGGSFVVNGPALPKNSALTTRGRRTAHHAETRRCSARFDGEFAAGSQTYAGSGTLRYAW